MAYTIDITAQLEKSRPTIQIGEELYELDDDKKNVVLTQQKLEKLGEDSDGFAELDVMLVGYYGKENLKLIEERHPGATTRIGSMQVLIKAAAAAIQGVSYEEASDSFRNAE